jgi:hypothetical protein
MAFRDFRTVVRNIYFARLGDSLSDPIKIGVTQNLAHRIKTLEDEYGCRIEVLGIMRGSWETEQALHHRFREFRVRRTEQFVPAEEILRFVKCHCRPWEARTPPPPGIEHWTITFTYRIDDLRWIERAAEHAGIPVRQFVDDAIACYAHRTNFDEPRPPLQAKPLQVNGEERDRLVPVEAVPESEAG